MVGQRLPSTVVSLVLRLSVTRCFPLVNLIRSSDEIRVKGKENFITFRMVSHEFHGAASIGYPGIIHGIFPNANVELINYFNEKCNSELNESLNKSVQSVSDLADTKKFIEHAFQLRLRMIIPYIEKWPQALAIMSVPNNVPTAFKTFSSLIDDVCYLSGDKSVDFNWYSRRAALAFIYKTTELCMIQDKTVDYIQTWKFLERRVDEAFKVDEVIRFNNNIVNAFKDITTASFRTLGNIIGWNHRTK